MQDFGNPDPRPLPDGWNQHYDASRNNWYYVQTNVMPPKVSYQHPADLRPEPTRRRGSRTSTMPPPPPMTMPMPSTSISPPPQSNGGSGLSFAQRLYASSNSTEQTPPLISATARDFGDMSTPHPPPIHTSSLPTLPTPLPSVSPGFRPPRTLPTIPQESHSLPPANATDFYNNKLGLGNSGNSRPAHPQTPSNSSWLPSSHNSTNSSFPSTYMNQSPEASPGHPSSHHPHLHRTQSYQIPPPPPLTKDPPHPHRASTYSVSSSARPPSSSGPRILSTTARPPSNAINTSDSTPHLQTAASPPQPVIQAPIPGVVASPLSLGLPSPPYSQGSLSPPINSPPPPSFFQTIPATNAQVAAQPQPKPPTISPAQAAQNEQRNELLKQIGIAVGKSAGKVALKVTGNALLNATGLSPDLFSGMGDILNSDAVGSLVDNLAGSNTAKPQAGSQAQSGADLQGIISALMQQQQQSNPQSQQPQQTPSVDYQALINELQKIQSNANAQQSVAQQQVAQQQVPAQTQAFSQFQTQLQQTQALLNAASKPPQQHNHQQHHHHQNNHHQHNHQQHNHQQHHHHHGGAASNLMAFQQQLQAIEASNLSGAGFNSGMSSFNPSGFDVVDPSIIAQGFAMQDAAIF